MPLKYFFVLMLSVLLNIAAQAAEIGGFDMKSCDKSFCYQIIAQTAQQSEFGGMFVLNDVMLRYTAAGKTHEIKAPKAHYNHTTKSIVFYQDASLTSGHKIVFILRDGFRPVSI
jgi:hypothetical protein